MCGCKRIGKKKSHVVSSCRVGKKTKSLNRVGKKTVLL